MRDFWFRAPAGDIQPVADRLVTAGFHNVRAVYDDVHFRLSTLAEQALAANQLLSLAQKLVDGALPDRDFLVQDS